PLHLETKLSACRRLLLLASVGRIIGLATVSVRKVRTAHETGCTGNRSEGSRIADVTGGEDHDCSGNGPPSLASHFAYVRLRPWWSDIKSGGGLSASSPAPPMIDGLTLSTSSTFSSRMLLAMCSAAIAASWDGNRALQARSA